MIYYFDNKQIEKLYKIKSVGVADTLNTIIIRVLDNETKEEHSFLVEPNYFSQDLDKFLKFVKEQLQDINFKVLNNYVYETYFYKDKTLRAIFIESIIDSKKELILKSICTY